MRYCRYFFLSLIVVLFSCEREALVEDIIDTQVVEPLKVLKASFASESRAYISDGFGSIQWAQGDSISVFDSQTSGGGNRFITVEGGSTADFAGQASDLTSGYYYGVYPYRTSSSLKGDVISAYFPGVQEAIPGTFDPNSFLMVGRSTGLEMGFYDALGGIRFTVEDGGYDQVIFQGNDNEQVAGNVSVRFGSDGFPVCEASGDASNSIVLNGDFNPGEMYYITMIPQAFKKGFTLSFCKNGNAVKTSVCNSFVRVERYYYATLRLADKPNALANILNGEPLDAAGTANCYIVREGGSFKFPLVKGNSSTQITNVSYAGVLWETDNTASAVSEGSLINPTVRIKNGYVYFKTADIYKEGNASIAVFDGNGEILWSWHIWLCDFDPDQTSQLYRGASQYMMDRNIGALSALPTTAMSYGLFYQWGRKDPFLGSADGSYTSMASTGEFDTCASADCGTVDYAVAHPTTFITCDTSTGNDWLRDGRDNTLWTAAKSIYDPCPVGWRIPDGGTGGVWASSASYSPDRYYRGATFALASSGNAWYPCTGYLDKGTGAFKLVGTFADYWTTTVASQAVTTFQIFLGDTPTDNDVKPYVNGRSRGEGHAVRCQKQ